MPVKSFDRVFPPIHFAKGTASEKALEAGEKSIIAQSRDDESRELYRTFDSDLKLYLSKIPTSPAQKHVSRLLDRELIFIGRSLTKEDGVFARLYMSANKVSGVVLDSLDIGIDMTTGRTVSIDDCAYAAYFGLVRAAIIVNRDRVRLDKNLHKILSNYLFLLILKSLDKNTIYTSKQRTFVQIICTYAYYRHFLRDSHAHTLRVIQRDYTDVIDKSDLAEFSPQLENIKHYDSTKDLPKMLVDTNVLRMNPNMITVGIFKKFRSQGLYAIFGPLDQFAAMAVTVKYPTELYVKEAMSTPKIHQSIEAAVERHLAKVAFEKTVLLNPEKR